MERLVTTAVIAAAALLIPICAPAQPDTPGPLLQLDRIEYRVGRTQASLEETGVTRARLDSLLSATLAAAGVAAEGTEETVADGLLSLQTTYLVNAGWHIGSLSLSFFRRTTLAAEPSVAVTAAVWTRGGIVVARKKKLWEELSAGLTDLLAEFIEDYRQANRNR